MKYLVLFSMLLLSACSLFEDKDALKPAELVEFEPSANLERLWKKDIKAGQGKGYTQLTPVISGETLYAVDHKGLVIALNRMTGKSLWSVDLEESITGGVGLGAAQLLLGTDNGEVVALSPDNGSELWRTALTSEIMSAPVGNNAIVAVQTLDGKLVVLDAKTGESLWFYENPPPALTLRGRPKPILTASGVYAGFPNGRLISFNAENGLILWEQRIAMPQGRSDLDKMVDIQASPILSDGIIYIVSFQGRLVALSRASGRPLWGVETSSYQELLLRGSALFVSSDDSIISAYKTGTGETLWTNEQLIRRRITGAATIDRYIAVADEDGYLHILDAIDGSFVDRARVDSSGVRAALLSVGGVLYAFANDGTLSAYQITERSTVK